MGCKSCLASPQFQRLVGAVFRPLIYRVFVCLSRLPYHLLDAGGSVIQVIRCLYIWHASSPMCPLQLCDWEPSELVTVHAYEALNDGVLGRVSRGNLLAVCRQVGRVFAV